MYCVCVRDKVSVEELGGEKKGEASCIKQRDLYVFLLPQCRAMPETDVCTGRKRQELLSKCWGKEKDDDGLTLRKAGPSVLASLLGSELLQACYSRPII